MDIAAYVKDNAPAIFDAGRHAYHELGRGALCVFPQHDSSNGKTPVTYHTEQALHDMASFDNPTLAVIKKYNPDNETILILGMDRPPGIYTYRIRLEPIPGPINLFTVTIVDWT